MREKLACASALCLLPSMHAAAPALPGIAPDAWPREKLATRREHSTVSDRRFLSGGTNANVDAAYCGYTLVSGSEAVACPATADIFVRGRWVEFGLHKTANSFGTSLLVPAGPDGEFHGNSNTGSMGFVADYGRDGWEEGSPPYSGDYFTPGSPFEGWAVEFNGVAYQNAGQMGLNQFPMESDTTVTSDGAVTWTGRQGDLRIQQQTSVTKLRLRPRQGPACLASNHARLLIDRCCRADLRRRFIHPRPRSHGHVDQRWNWHPFKPMLHPQRGP